MKHKNDFEFNYVAPTSEERKEIESIKSKYEPEGTGSEKLSMLRHLDSKVKNTPTIVSLILGIVGILTFGTGLTMILEWQIMLWGIAISIVGFIPTLLAYPTYKLIFSKMKKKYASQILQLSDELLNEQHEIEK